MDYKEYAKVVPIKDLPFWIDKIDVSRDSQYALVIEHDKYKAFYEDNMEPEDANFYRDLSWIVDELNRAYNSNNELVTALQSKLVTLISALVTTSSTLARLNYTLEQLGSPKVQEVENVLKKAELALGHETFRMASIPITNERMTVLHHPASDLGKLGTYILDSIWRVRLWKLHKNS